jgi:hypothetical protein
MEEHWYRVPLISNTNIVWIWSHSMILWYKTLNPYFSVSIWSLMPSINSHVEPLNPIPQSGSERMAFHKWKASCQVGPSCQPSWLPIANLFSYINTFLSSYALCLLLVASHEPVNCTDQKGELLERKVPTNNVYHPQKVTKTNTQMYLYCHQWCW